MQLRRVFPAAALVLAITMMPARAENPTAVANFDTSDGPWNDIHSCWLPDGDIAFVSERRGGFLRCGRVCPVYTIHHMDARGEKPQLRIE